MDRVGRVLIVEDDDALACALEAFASRRAASVQRAATKARALEILEAVDVDVLMLDIGLPDGSGDQLLGVLAQKPVFARVIAVSGSADPMTAFALAQAGVRRFVTKPLNLGELERAWEQALKEAPDLRPFIRACVGRRNLHELEGMVRDEMTAEAMAEGGGSRRKASSILGISRQLLQRILRQRD